MIAADDPQPRSERSRRAPRRPRAGGFIDVVFDGPPGPEPPTFVEVEDADGRSVSLGEWVERDDGYWALRLPG